MPRRLMEAAIGDVTLGGSCSSSASDNVGWLQKDRRSLPGFPAHSLCDAHGCVVKWRSIISKLQCAVVNAYSRAMAGHCVHLLGVQVSQLTVKPMLILDAWCDTMQLLDAAVVVGLCRDGVVANCEKELEAPRV